MRRTKDERNGVSEDGQNPDDETFSVSGDIEDEQNGVSENEKRTDDETFSIPGDFEDERNGVSENGQNPDDETFSIPGDFEDERKAVDEDEQRTDDETFSIQSDIEDEQKAISETELSAEEEIFSVPGDMDLKINKRRLPEKKIFQWAKLILIVLVPALVLKAIAIQSYMIPTGSMEPTIMPRDRVYGNRFIYRFRDPRAGDVIAFNAPAAAYSGTYPADEMKNAHFSLFGNKNKLMPFLKRVIAVEGDTVEVRGGVVYVNGVPLDEPYIMATPNYEFPPEKVPKGDLFVLGDSRRDSDDSHIWGFLAKKNVQAKVFFRYWPINRVGVVK